MTKKNLRAGGRALTTLAVVVFFINASLIGATGQAQALDLEECAKDVVTGAWTETVLDYVMGNPNYCLEITDGDFTNTSRADLKASLESSRTSAEQLNTTMMNRLQDSQSVAMTKAKITIVNELNNGSTRAEAKAAAKETIIEYYSKIELNVVQQWNSKLVEWNYAWEVEEGETGSTGNWMDWAGDSDSFVNGIYPASTGIATVELMNGTSVPIGLIDLRNQGVGSDNQYPWVGHPYVVEQDVNRSMLEDGTTGSFDLFGNFGDNVSFIGPQGDNVVMYVTEGETTGVYNGRIEEIRAQNDSAVANIDAYVEGIYDYYSQGELNTTDILDPTEIYQEASTDRNTTGYYGWASVQLASIGYGGNTEHSHTINTTWNGSNVLWEGTLFYTADDLGTIESGTTYDPSTYTGSFLMAVQLSEDESAIRELKNNFTVVETVDVRTGETIQNTTVERKVYETTNVSDLDTELQKLRELRQEYENQTTFASSGGGGDGGGSGGFDLGLGLGSGGLVVGVVLVLAVLAARG